MKTWDPLFERKLLHAPDYRAFLRLFFVKDGAWVHPKPLSFAAFAERSGYSSKGFINDAIAGRKRLDPSSLEKVAKGLRLNADWKEYLRCLVTNEESEERSQDDEHRLSCQRKKIERRLSTVPITGWNAALEVYLEPSFPEVYSALGNVGEGETLETISARAKLPVARVLEVVRRMKEAGLAEENRTTGKIAPLAITLQTDGIGSESLFRAEFMRSVDKARTRFDAQANSDLSLFMTQTFSVSSADLPRLKQELASVIRNFAVDAERSNGDCIAEVCVGFTNNLSSGKT